MNQLIYQSVNEVISPVPVCGVLFVTMTAVPSDPRAFKMTPKPEIRGSIITVFPKNNFQRTSKREMNLISKPYFVLFQWNKTAMK